MGLDVEVTIAYGIILSPDEYKSGKFPDKDSYVCPGDAEDEMAEIIEKMINYKFNVNLCCDENVFIGKIINKIESTKAGGCRTYFGEIDVDQIGKISKNQEINGKLYELCTKLNIKCSPKGLSANLLLIFFIKK